MTQILRPSEDQQQVDRKRILSLATSYPLPSEWSDVADVWPLILNGLDHQGHPRDNLKTMLEVLKTRRSRGWDEFSLDFEDGDMLNAAPRPNSVFVYFLGDCRPCDRDRLLHVLQAIQSLLENSDLGAHDKQQGTPNI